MAEHSLPVKVPKMNVFRRTLWAAARAVYGSLPTSFIMSPLLLVKYTELLYAKTMEANADNLFQS